MAIEAGERVIEHVRQRTSYDCGVAVASMLTALPYELVRLVAEECQLTSARGMSPTGLARLLTNVSGVAWRRRRPAALGPFGTARLSRFAALLAVDENKGHWVAVSSGRVYDPERPDSVPIGTYSEGLERRVAFVVARAAE